MAISLGVDTLSYHCRIEAGEISLEQISREVAELGFEFVQVNAFHLRKRSSREAAAYADDARKLGLDVTLAADVVGRPEQDSPGVGVKRLAEWVHLATQLGSPYVRVSSGFYRNEVEDKSTIRRHQDFLIETFRKFLAEHPDAQVPILLENHSDFTPEEYSEILSAIGSDRVAVFLDVINPVTMLMDPLPVVKALAPMALAGHVKDFRMVSHYVEDGFHRRGFDVQYCYPGEGMAVMDSLIGALPREPGKTYYLSIEGLDNHPGVADQRSRLSASAARLRPLIGS